jgi:hypothetical protein
VLASIILLFRISSAACSCHTPNPITSALCRQTSWTEPLRFQKKQTHVQRRTVSRNHHGWTMLQGISPPGPHLITMTLWVLKYWYWYWCNMSWFAMTTTGDIVPSHQTYLKRKYNLFFQTSSTLNIDEIPTLLTWTLKLMHA